MNPEDEMANMVDDLRYVIEAEGPAYEPLTDMEMPSDDEHAQMEKEYFDNK